MFFEDLPMDRIQLAGHAVQQLRPVGPQLPAHQPLRLAPVGDPGETVVLPHVLQARCVHLPRQPFAAVQADLDRKGKPGLNAGVQKAKHRMYPVVVQEEALAVARLQFQFLGLAVAVDLEAPARLYATQHTHQPVVNPFLGRDAAGDLFLAHLAGGQVLHGPPHSFRLRQRRLLQPAAHPLHVRTEVLQQNLIRPQVALHPLVVGDGTECAAKDQPVKTRQRAGELVLVFRDKLVHGVSVSPPDGWSWKTNILRDRKRHHCLVAAMPRSDSIW